MLPVVNGSIPVDASRFDATAIGPPSSSCAWWNLACKGGEHVANSGLSAITRSIASGAEMLLGQIVQVIDDSATVPLADPTYRHIYFGFLGLAAPLVGVVLCIALIMASLRRDPATLGRAVVGVGVAGLGGALYIAFAQLLVVLDEYLSRGIVRVTGYNLAQAIESLAAGFHSMAGAPGEMAANMLLILLMLIMLIAGLILWFVLVLRKMAILVVVAFAPLLIAGYLWAPTRSWVRKLTEVLIALVFTKTAIFALFGIGLALLSRGTAQSLSDFVGTTVLLCGACFAPLVMLRLVHFAADTHLAGDAIGTLRGGMNPVTSRLGQVAPGSTMGRSDLARSQSGAPQPEPATTGTTNPGANAGTGTAAAAGGTAGSAGAGAGAGAGGVGAAGAAGGPVAAGALAAAAAATATRDATTGAATRLAEHSTSSSVHGGGWGDRPLHGPALAPREQSHLESHPEGDR